MEITTYIRKAGESVTIDFDELAPNVQTFIIEYGLRQKLNDAHSQVDKDDKAAVMTAVNRVVDAFKSGRIPSGGGSSLDPVEVAARAQLVAFLMKLGNTKKAATALLKACDNSAESAWSVSAF